MTELVTTAGSRGFDLFIELKARRGKTRKVVCVVCGVRWWWWWAVVVVVVVVVVVGVVRMEHHCTKKNENILVEVGEFEAYLLCPTDGDGYS